MIQFNNPRRQKEERTPKLKRKRVRSAKKPRIIIDASAANKNPIQSSQLKNNDSSRVTIGVPARKNLESKIYSNPSKSDLKATKRDLAKNMDSQKMSAIECFLDRIETIEEKCTLNLKLNCEGTNTLNSSRKSILMNQNHSSYKLGYPARKPQSNKNSTLAPTETDDELFALQS